MRRTASRDRITDALATARARQERLLEHLDEQDLTRQVSPLMSPLCWDMAHIAHYEELWLVRALVDTAPTDEQFDDLYDAFAHGRAERAELDILGPEDARRYAAATRERSLEVLAAVDVDTDRAVVRDGRSAVRDGHPLLRDGFVYGLVVQHEHQHIETMLATLSLMEEAVVAPGVPPAAPEPPADLPDEVLVAGGPGTMGTDTEPWAYDNERPAHTVDLAPFWIDTTPVTNEAYAEFVAAGGYDDPRWWSDAGWAWRTKAGLEHPQFWRRVGDTWHRRRFGVDEPLSPREPVQHVCWYEADAYARWRGKRLPTEAEWERAATGGAPRRHPWGDGEPTDAHAALAPSPEGNGTERFAPGSVGIRPDGASPCGAQDLIGGVWEWTATTFDAYPGFRAFPYREYSEVFFGDGYKVLRGGSWATHPHVVRTTFRNWDWPVRRQIFAGFRCARDASE